MVVDDLDLLRSLFRPAEADRVSLVDPNAVLSPTVSPQSLESVPRRSAKILQHLGLVDLVQLAARYNPQLHGPGFSGAPRIPAIENVPGTRASTDSPISGGFHEEQ